MAKEEKEELEQEKAAKKERHDLGERLKDPDITEEEKAEIHAKIAQLDREPYHETETQRVHREHDEREKKIDALIEEKNETTSESKKK